MIYSDKVQQAITNGLTTEEHINEIMTIALDSHIDTLVDRDNADKLANLLRENTKLEELCTITRYTDVTLYIRQRANTTIHDIRSELRVSLGSWSDKIVSTYISGDELQVTYKSNSKVNNVDVDIIVYYPLDDLPTGLLKPTCKIVESTCKSIQCSID